MHLMAAGTCKPRDSGHKMAWTDMLPYRIQRSESPPHWSCCAIRLNLETSAPYPISALCWRTLDDMFLPEFLAQVFVSLTDQSSGGRLDSPTKEEEPWPDRAILRKTHNSEPKHAW